MISRPHESLSSGVRSDTYYYYKNKKKTDIYILDTGVYIDHQDIKHNAKDFPKGIDKKKDGRKYAESYYCPRHLSSSQRRLQDMGGHGTHVACTAAGWDWGVAKEANIWALKVLCEGGVSSGMINQAVQDVGETHIEKRNNPKLYPDFAGSVINMSMDIGPKTSSWEFVFTGAAGNGVVASIAAENEDVETKEFQCNHRIGVVCVGNVDKYYRKATRSAYGPKIYIAGPGTDVESCGIRGPSSTSTKSGTSMASPHVVGVIAQAIGMYQYNKPESNAELLKTIEEWAAPPSVLSGYRGHVPFMINNGIDRRLPGSVSTV